MSKQISWRPISTKSKPYYCEPQLFKSPDISYPPSLEICGVWTYWNLLRILASNLNSRKIKFRRWKNSDLRDSNINVHEAPVSTIGTSYHTRPIARSISSSSRLSLLLRLSHSNPGSPFCLSIPCESVEFPSESSETPEPGPGLSAQIFSPNNFTCLTRTKEEHIWPVV